MPLLQPTGKLNRRKTAIRISLLITNRDQKETLTQNYRRLGLASKLNAATGGTEKTGAILDAKAADTNGPTTLDALNINKAIPKTIEVTEVRIVRDPETGAILEVIDEPKKANPLNDALNHLDDDEGDEWNGFANEHGVVDGAGAAESGKTSVVRELEELAASAAPKKPRTQSEREGEWIQDLVQKHGDDYLAMSRDMKLNPRQQTVGDLKKRVKKWQASRKA